MTVVFHDDYSEQLEKLAFRTPVWIVESPANRQAAERAWHAAVEWPHISVTLFRYDDWRTIIGQVLLHHPNATTLDFIGSALTPPARTALDDAGFTRFDETADGFKARRS